MWYSLFIWKELHYSICFRISLPKKFIVTQKVLINLYRNLIDLVLYNDDSSSDTADCWTESLNLVLVFIKLNRYCAKLWNTTNIKQFSKLKLEFIANHPKIWKILHLNHYHRFLKVSAKALSQIDSEFILNEIAAELCFRVIGDLDI